MKYISQPAILLIALCMAACSAMQPRNSLCSLKLGDCTPEEIVTLPQSQLRVADLISMSCGVTALDDKDAARALCEKRVKSMLARWSRTLPSLVSDPGSIQVTEAETCLDTFVPGREAADCQFV
jgi:hypothetical protein